MVYASEDARLGVSRSLQGSQDYAEVPRLVCVDLAGCEA